MFAVCSQAEVHSFFYDDLDVFSASGKAKEVRIYVCAYEGGRYIPLTVNGPVSASPGDRMTAVEGFDELYRLDIDTEYDVYGVIFYRYDSAGNISGRKEIIFPFNGMEWSGSGYFTLDRYIGEMLPMEKRSETVLYVNDIGDWNKHEGGFIVELFSQSDGFWQECIAADESQLKRCVVEKDVDSDRFRCRYVSLSSNSFDHVKVSLADSPSSMVIARLKQNEVYSTGVGIAPVTIYFDCQSYYESGFSEQIGFPMEYSNGAYVARFYYRSGIGNQFKFAARGPGNGNLSVLNPLNSEVIFPDLFNRPKDSPAPFAIEYNRSYRFTDPFPTTCSLYPPEPTGKSKVLEARVVLDSPEDVSSGAILIREVDYPPLTLELSQRRDEDGKYTFDLLVDIIANEDALSLVASDSGSAAKFESIMLYTSDRTIAESLNATSNDNAPRFSYDTKFISDVPTEGWWAYLPSCDEINAVKKMSVDYSDIDPCASYSLTAYCVPEGDIDIWNAAGISLKSEQCSSRLFIPEPSVELTPLTTTHEIVSSEKYLAVTDASTMPAGAMVNGDVVAPVYYDMVNTLSCTVDLIPNVSVSDNWEVCYSAEYQGEPIAGFGAGRGELYGIVEPEIEEGDFIITAIYTRKIDSLKIETSAPTIWRPEAYGDDYARVTVDSGAYVIIAGDNSCTPDGYVNYDLVAEYHIRTKQTLSRNPVAYVGFNLQIEGREGHENHVNPINSGAFKGRVLSQSEYYNDPVYPVGISGVEGYECYSAPTWQSENNWSRLAVENGRLPLHIHHITCAPIGGYAAENPRMSVSFDMIYPIYGYRVPRYRKEGMPVMAYEDIDSRYLHLLTHYGSESEDTSHTSTFSGTLFNEQTTGITAVLYGDGSEVPVRYLDIHGRDNGSDPDNLRPGIYITTGITPRKIIITSDSRGAASSLIVSPDKRAW